MRTAAMFLAAAIALGVAGQADAQVIRDHRGSSYRHARTYHVRHARDYRSYRWQFDTPSRDPLYFRYPGVVAPRMPIQVIYDASGRYMWIGGYWEWHRGQWLWIDGYWEPVRAGYYYEPGYWHWHDRGWQRSTGHWRRLPANRGDYRIIRRDHRINERVPARRGFNRH